jgi:tetrahydromethanopterin S-methyltransferase subunit D
VSGIITADMLSTTSNRRCWRARMGSAIADLAGPKRPSPIPSSPMSMWSSRTGVGAGTPTACVRSGVLGDEALHGNGPSLVITNIVITGVDITAAGRDQPSAKGRKSPLTWSSRASHRRTEFEQSKTSV